MISKAKLGDLCKSGALAGALLCAVYLATFGIMAAVIVYLIGGWLSQSLRPSTNPYPFLAGLMYLYLSSLLFADSSVFPGRPGRIDCLVALGASGIVLWSCCTGYARHGFVVALVAASAIVTASAGFFIESGGRLIFSDDHPAFLYRLTQLRHNFPLVPFFNPSWNAGVEAREFFPSGSLGLFLLWLPVVYFTDLLNSYNYIVVGSLFFVVPGFMFAAARVGALPTAASLIASTLSLCVSALWYRWGLTYGTLPFILSASAIPSCVALCGRYLSREQSFELRHGVLFLAACSMAIFWTPAAILLTPLILLALICGGSVLSRPYFPAAVCACAAIHAPWLLLFVEASHVLDFLSVTKSSGGTLSATTVAGHPATHAAPFISPLIAKNGRLYGGMLLAQEFLRSTNPLLLLLAIPGVAKLSKPLRRVTTLFLLWVLVVAVLGPIVKPQLELQRFWLVAALVCVPSVAALIQTLFGSTKVDPLARICHYVALTTIALALGSIPMTLWRVVRNQSNERYTFATSEVFELPRVIEQFGGDGRALFAGFVLHEVSNGHIAPFPLLTQKPLVASSYQHDKWRWTDIIPAAYKHRKVEGVEEYLDLMNVTLVVSHDRFWKTWFRNLKDRYREVAAVGPFVAFTRTNYISSYFSNGSGELLEQADNRLVVRVDSTDSTIKFNYLPLLRSDTCSLVPRPMAGGITLIGIVGCQPGEVVTIKMISPIARVGRLLRSLVSGRE